MTRKVQKQMQILYSSMYIIYLFAVNIMTATHTIRIILQTS